MDGEVVGTIAHALRWLRTRRGERRALPRGTLRAAAPPHRGPPWRPLRAQPTWRSSLRREIGAGGHRAPMNTHAARAQRAASPHISPITHPKHTQNDNIKPVVSGDNNPHCRALHAFWSTCVLEIVLSSSLLRCAHGSAPYHTQKQKRTTKSGRAESSPPRGRIAWHVVPTHPITAASGETRRPRGGSA